MIPALVVVGYGHVGRRFVRLLEETADTLAGLGIHPRIVAVATRRHGAIADVQGLDQARIDAALAGTTPSETASSASFITDVVARVRERGDLVPMVVEITTLDIERGEPAISHVRAALAAGAHVISANKGPVAFAHRALADEARRSSRDYLFEGAVMDGIPIFNLVRETMPAVEIRGFRGVVNSTTNFILTALEQGEPFADALARMQAAGIAEADPRHDVDGWDAAAKAAALANVLLEADVTPHDVVREGLGPDVGARAIATRADGRRLKLVASATGRGADVRLRVALESLGHDDPLAALEGMANALELDTWPLGRVVITQRDGGLEITAYALLADMVTICRKG
ncbi:homoserine dehydrogenase [Luteitalea sp.]|uniref:homoserine dehydrogenase n=1 Tax=Luteitalea sp. TaxID=2004800 RepID=UPI0037CAE79F